MLAGPSLAAASNGTILADGAAGRACAPTQDHAVRMSHSSGLRLSRREPGQCRRWDSRGSMERCPRRSRFEPPARRASNAGTPHSRRRGGTSLRGRSSDRGSPARTRRQVALAEPQNRRYAISGRRARMRRAARGGRRSSAGRPHHPRVRSAGRHIDRGQETVAVRDQRLTTELCGTLVHGEFSVVSHALPGIGCLTEHTLVRSAMAYARSVSTRWHQLRSRAGQPDLRRRGDQVHSGCPVGAGTASVERSP